MASLTQGEIVHQVAIKLEDTSHKRYSQEQLRIWINEGANDVARRAECNMAETFVTIAAGTQAVNAPSSIVRIHRVAYARDNDLTEYDLQYIAYKNMSSVAWTTIRQTSGIPELYWTWKYPPNLQINVYPIPSSSGSLRISYYRLPTPLSIDNTTDDSAVALDVPDGWGDLVMDYVIAEALMVDRDPRWQDYKTRYAERLAAMAEAAINFTDQAGSIVNGTNMIPGWLYDPNWD